MGGAFYGHGWQFLPLQLVIKSLKYLIGHLKNTLNYKMQEEPLYETYSLTNTK